MDLSPREYQAYIKRKQEPSPLLKNMALAFVTGETICVLGQLLINGYQAPGLYHRLARFAGAGTLVPITGFANAVVSPAVDFRAEGLVTGTAVHRRSRHRLRHGGQRRVRGVPAASGRMKNACRRDLRRQAFYRCQKICPTRAISAPSSMGASRSTA